MTRPLKVAAVSASVIAGLVLVILIGGHVYAQTFEGKIYPGVRVAGQPADGWTREALSANINGRVDTILSNGVLMRVEGTDKEARITLRSVAPNDPDLAREFVVFDVDGTINAAYRVGREGSIFKKISDFVAAQTRGIEIPVKSTFDEEAIRDLIFAAFEEEYNPAQEPAFDFSGDETVIIPGQTGRTIHLDIAMNQLMDSVGQFGSDVVLLEMTEDVPSVSDEAAEGLIDQAERVLSWAPILFVHEASAFESFEIELEVDELQEMLSVTSVDGEARLHITEQAATSFFEAMADEINVEPVNARFSMDNDRVEEFVPSKTGRVVDVNATREALLTRLMWQDIRCATQEDCDALEETENVSAEDEEEIVEEVPLDPALIQIVVDTTQAEVTTDSVNDLGITEILGVGYSNFAGSPSNRRANIRHGISKLDGILIAPDEEFSLISALKPFTLADGYLPELVIKGDEIKPEIGGGLCQIGSTTFRAVMNSGLKITQRRNHSLVVNYYNDPSNGNPGTDATLYDPAPDFRFVNDTGNYILLDTEMDEANSELRFTFWGTSDGRQGSYTPPVVHSWTSPGPTQTTYTTELAPGVRKCQGAHPGANTSFSYLIERPDGEVEETVFTSHYRPLPTICLEGAPAEEFAEDGSYIGPPETPDEDAETAAEALAEEESAPTLTE